MASAAVSTITINSPINDTTYNMNFFVVNNWRVGRIQLDLELDEDALLHNSFINSHLIDNYASA